MWYDLLKMNIWYHAILSSDVYNTLMIISTQFIPVHLSFSYFFNKFFLLFIHSFLTSGKYLLLYFSMKVNSLLSFGHTAEAQTHRKRMRGFYVLC